MAVWVFILKVNVDNYCLKIIHFFNLNSGLNFGEYYIEPLRQEIPFISAYPVMFSFNGWNHHVPCFNRGSFIGYIYKGNFCL